MSTFVTRAIPLRIQPLAKQDELVTLLTASHGKIKAKVRSGQKVVSKLSNRLHTLQELDVMIAQGKSFAIVAGVTTRLQLKNLQNNLDRRILALTLLDVINTVAPEYESDIALYNFTLFWLHVMADLDLAVDAPFCALVFWRLLKYIGLSPDFSHGHNLSASNRMILEKILQVDTEVQILEFILNLDKKISLPAARIALQRLQHLLESEVRGLRVLSTL